jgi:hypothetical protein
MEWAVLRYSKKTVIRAGQALLNPDPITDEDWDQLWDIISNWRASHNFPLNTFQNGLRKRARKIDKNCIVAQRIKRLVSIALKLQRFPQMTPVTDARHRRLPRHPFNHLRRAKIGSRLQTSNLKHELVTEDDYIRTPRESGYRGVHLIYKYRSDKRTEYNGLKIEMQLRSQMQHIWATAVETVGTFTEQALKSSQGEADWLRFFALMGTVFADAERAPPVPNTPDGKTLVAELRALTSKLSVQSQLDTFGSAVQVIEGREDRNDHYYLLELDPRNKKVNVSAYSAAESEAAETAYLQVEKKLNKQTGAQAVLVSVDKVSSLRRAYPNYFLDTRNFVSLLNDAFGWPEAPSAKAQS